MVQLFLKKILSKWLKIQTIFETTKVFKASKENGSVLEETNRQ
jgi:hypothetical protein